MTSHADPAAPANVDPAVVAQVAAVDPWHRFDRWTSTFFLSIAVVTALASLTVGSVALNDPTVPGAAVAAMVLVSIVEIAILALASAGLDRGRPWGRPVAFGLLLVTIGADAVRVPLDLTRGQVTIPLAGIVALYLLSTKPGPLPALGGRERRIAGGILAAAVLAQLAAFVPGALAS